MNRADCLHAHALERAEAIVGRLARFEDEREILGDIGNLLQIVAFVLQDEPRISAQAAEASEPPTIGVPAGLVGRLENLVTEHQAVEPDGDPEGVTRFVKAAVVAEGIRALERTLRPEKRQVRRTVHSQSLGDAE